MVNNRKKEKETYEKENNFQVSALKKKLNTAWGIIKELYEYLQSGKGIKFTLRIFLRIFFEKILKMFYQLLPHKGVKVVEEDWDYLIVLTACRYDAFKLLNDLPGKLEKRISLGSSTLEWLKKNFTDYYDDIVYVSANPRISDTEFAGFKGTDHFFKVINVWKGWSRKLNTILPSEVTKTALKVVRRFPNKRIIIHYLQPHAPWIGKTTLAGEELGLSFSDPIEWYRNASKIGRRGIWSRAEILGYTLKFLRKCYIDNLRIVLEEVKKLIDKLDGKIVVTSDHGELFGEAFLVEHPTGIYLRKLVEVPWLIIEKKH